MLRTMLSHFKFLIQNFSSQAFSVYLGDIYQNIVDKYAVQLVVWSNAGQTTG
jgi:hypothetical protein